MMKNTILLLSCLLLLVTACTKEELVVVDEPTEVNEDSPIFQSYLAERALSFIKIYRFDKLGDILDRINDPAVKNEVTAVYKEYKTRADREALYFVNPANDTLYFLIASETETDPATRTDLNINMENTNVPKSKGVLSGLAKFPKLERLDMYYALADEVKQLDAVPELNYFSWNKNEDFFKMHFPGEEFVPGKLVADFSKNSKLKTIRLYNINIQDLVFPTTKMDLIELNENSIYNSNDVLNSIKTDLLYLVGRSSRNSFVLNNNNINHITVKGIPGENFGITKIDLSETKLQTAILGGGFLEELKLNDGLKLLSTGAEKLKEKPLFPLSLEELDLLNYKLSNLDFSDNTNLKKLTLNVSGIENVYDNAALILPSNLEEFSYTAHGSRNQLDLSYLNKVRSVEITGANDVLFPPNVENVNMQYISGVLNLGGLQQLKRIQIYTASNFGELDEIIFPPNLTEADIHDFDNNFYTSITISRQCKLTNMPQWMHQFINYSN